MTRGYFTDDSMLRRVNRERALALAGPRALLMQAAHPLAVAGLLAHSTALDEPYERLARTAQVLSTIGFWSRRDADRVTARVRAAPSVSAAGFRTPSVRTRPVRSTAPTTRSCCVPPRIGRVNNRPTEVIMSEHAATPQYEVPAIPSLRDSVRKLTGYWWLLLAVGIAWVTVALVILQFDQASLATVGVLVGLMFLGVDIENLALARLEVPMRWAWALFGGLFVVSAVVCFANPTDTFAGLADMLGFLFLIVGVWWMVRAFLERAINPLWWTGLVSGILMTGLAFWTSGQFFIHKAYVLLVFAGIWALMQGITNIVRAFQIRALHEEL